MSNLLLVGEVLDIEAVISCAAISLNTQALNHDGESSTDLGPDARHPKCGWGGCLVRFQGLGFRASLGFIGFRGLGSKVSGSRDTSDLPPKAGRKLDPKCIRDLC